VFSHRPAIVSSTLVLLYLLYLYITRTVLDVFDCTPTSPPDGFTYLKVVFERCGVPGGTQLTLLPAALAGLGAYTLGYPAYIARALWRNRELIMEDQLLRAKGVGNDLLTNPHAFDLRRTLGRSYFQFKPRFFRVDPGDCGAKVCHCSGCRDVLKVRGLPNGVLPAHHVRGVLAAGAGAPVHGAR